MNYLLEWRPALSAGSSLFFRSALLRGRDETMALAATLSDGDPAISEFRVQATDASGASSGQAMHTTADAVRTWPWDEPMPAGVATGWARDLERAGARRRAAAAMAKTLREAGSAGLLCREQVADILNVVEQAFDRIGKAAQRLPI